MIGELEGTVIRNTLHPKKVIKLGGWNSITTDRFYFSPSPQTLLAGMNKFLSQLEITFRRDPNNYRPRINKLNSIKVCRNITLNHG